MATFNNGDIDNWAVSFNERVLGSNDFSSFVQRGLFTTSDNLSEGNPFDTSFFDQRINNQFFDVESAVNDSPGTWTLREDQVSAVPVPAALPLMASALGFFGFARRKFNA